MSTATAAPNALRDAPTAQVAEEGLIACEHCRAPFRQRRTWAKFCSATCRNGYHTLRAASPRLMAALRQIAAGAENPAELAKQAIGELKAP